MWCFYGLDNVPIYACFDDTYILASMTHLWATVRGISLPVANSPMPYTALVGWALNQLSPASQVYESTFDMLQKALSISVQPPTVSEVALQFGCEVLAKVCWGSS
jgi:hypothetical protein